MGTQGVDQPERWTLSERGRAITVANAQSAEPGDWQRLLGAARALLEPRCDRRRRAAGSAQTARRPGRPHHRPSTGHHLWDG